MSAPFHGIVLPAIVLIAFSLTSCRGAEGVSAPDAVGQISGVITLMGGPNSGQSQSPRPAADDGVDVFRGTELVTSTTTSSGGAFHLSLPAGEYKVVANCGDSKTIEVAASGNQTVALVCNAP